MGTKRSTFVRSVGLASISLAVLLAALFLPAGRLDWWRGWAYAGLFAATMVPFTAFVFLRAPDLMRRRFRAGPGTKAWDRLLVPLLKLSFTLVILVAAFTCGRTGRPDLPGLLWPVGAALFVAGVVILARAMTVNPHFETTVRIQHDRNHRVVSEGPYRYVRHPGYAAFCLLLAGTPLLLGSGWAFLPAAAAAAVLVARILLEERTLREGLEGYREYAARVRARLLPGVW